MPMTRECRQRQAKFKLAGAPLTLEDALFGIIQESQRLVDLVINGFEKEAAALNSLSHNLSHMEKMDFARRSHEAKQAMIAFNLELKGKDTFIAHMMPTASAKMNLLLRMLRGRLQNCQHIMERSN